MEVHVLFHLVCIPFADILIRTLSTKGNYFETQLLNKSHTLIFLEFISISNSHHKFFFCLQNFRFFQIAKLTNISVGSLLFSTHIFFFHFHYCLNSHSQFFCSDYAKNLEQTSWCTPFNLCIMASILLLKHKFTHVGNSFKLFKMALRSQNQVQLLSWLAVFLDHVREIFPELSLNPPLPPYAHTHTVCSIHFEIIVGCQTYLVISPPQALSE